MWTMVRAELRARWRASVGLALIGLFGGDRGRGGGTQVTAHPDFLDVQRAQDVAIGIGTVT